MTEPVFLIVPEKHTFSEPVSKPASRYSSLLHSFITTSYGYYSEMFIKKIAEKAEVEQEELRRCDLRKNLRQSSKKYLLSDLQIVFLGHFCQKNSWNWRHKEAQLYAKGKYSVDQLNQSQMRIFIQFNAYFVKSYLGTQDQFSQLQSYFEEEDPNFLTHFELWASSLHKERFIVSPRQINLIYSKYSRNCQNHSNKKDYNELVDTIIELSTTYSIIPGKKNEKQKEEKISNSPKMVKPVMKRQERVNPNQPNLSKIHSIINPIQESNLEIDLPYTRKESARLRPLNEMSLIDYRKGNSSSAIFEGLFGSERNSDLRRNNSRNNPQEQVDRSRQKKVLKRLTKFHKQSEKPNEAVIGFITNQGGEVSAEKQKQGKHFLRDRSNRNVNQSYGLFNIQSNLSSKSYILPPLPYRGSQDGFFDRSRLD